MNPTYRIPRSSLTSTPPPPVPEAPVRLAIYANLRGTVCVCGGKKRARQSFCRGHYFKLPPLLRSELYQSDGYPATFLRACKTLALPAPEAVFESK